MYKRPEGLESDCMMGPQELFFYKRVLFVYGPLFPYPHRADMFSPTLLVDSMWALDSISHDPITLVIDSPGGSVTAGLNVYDMMKLVKSPVITVGRNCFSMAAILLAAGNKGKRYVFPHASVMLHLPTSQASDKGYDPLQMAKEAEEFTRVKEELVDLLMDCGARSDMLKTNMRKKSILKDIDRVFYLTAKEAVEYGIADAILQPDDLDLGLFPNGLVPDACYSGLATAKRMPAHTPVRQEKK